MQILFERKISFCMKVHVNNALWNLIAARLQGIGCILGILVLLVQGLEGLAVKSAILLDSLKLDIDLPIFKADLKCFETSR